MCLRQNALRSEYGRLETYISVAVPRPFLQDIEGESISSTSAYYILDKERHSLVHGLSDTTDGFSLQT